MQKPGRVLILRSNPVDPDPRVEKEADTLLKAGYPVDIFCWDRSSDHDVERSTKKLDSGDCTIYRAGIKSSFGLGFRGNIKPLLRFQLEILKFIKQNRSKYDVIHSCDFDTAFAGFIGRSKKHSKQVYDIFDYYADAFGVPSFLKKMIVAIDTFVIEHADAVIICSESRKKQLGKAKPKRLVVIHNSPAIPEDIKGSSKDDSSGRFRIVYVGILSDGRLIPELLEIVSRHKEYELKIAGFGKYEALAEEYADKYDNIEFFGRIGYSQTLELEKESDVMTAIYDPAVPNHRYAAPNKFYEALMLGKPLIMCRNTGFSDLIEKNGFGVCIDYSGDFLEEGLEEIKGNYEKFSACKSAEKGLFRKNYSWDIMSERLKELYSML